MTELERLTLEIQYDNKKNAITFGGDIKAEAREEIIAEYLRTQIGRGEDDSPRNERDTYTIKIHWQPDYDTFVCEHDTGNKSLRDGILVYALQKIGKNN